MEVNPCKNLPNWDWQSGETYTDDTTDIEFKRNYFDCGVYFFDGTFNVVKFPKGMTLYHGSNILANAIVEFPVGIDYYKPYDMSNVTENIQINQDMMNPSVVAISDENIEEIISESFNITAGWYGSPSIAQMYSAIPHPANPGLADVCKDRCVFAYRLEKDITLLLLDDDYNINKLFNHPGTDKATIDMKSSLAYMFKIQDPQPQQINEYNPIRRKYYDKDRLSVRDRDTIVANWLCNNVISQYGYAGYGASEIVSTISPNSKFHLEIIFCNAFKWLKRDLYNILDWQHVGKPNNEVIRRFMTQLGLYQSTNVNFHAGDLLEHSIWSLLFSELIMESNNIIPPIGVTDEIRKVIAFTAFIHDIGKMAPQQNQEVFPNINRRKFIYFAVPTHPQIGEEYILGDIIPEYNPVTLQHVNNINVNQLFNAFGIDHVMYRNSVRIVIRFHWDFGDTLRQFNNTQRTDADADLLILRYLSKVRSVLPPNTTQQDFTIIIYMLLIVSVADISGGQPYGKNRIATSSNAVLQINKASLFFPFITNMPKKYRGGNVVEISELETIGIQFANRIIALIPNLWYQLRI